VDGGQLATALELKPGMSVADIGAGFGATTLVLSKWIGPTGRIYATDIAPNQLDALRELTAREQLSNVVVLEGSADSTNLPAACCDALLMRDVYHHIMRPEVFDRSAVAALKAGGRLAVIDFEPEPGSELPAGVPASR
jgi:ubiquinone/menaquinone biosynthesis C-methylase UbiE